MLPHLSQLDTAPRQPLASVLSELDLGLGLGLLLLALAGCGPPR
jgi:hypothetical protein